MKALKRIVAGISMLFCGILLYLGTSIAAVIYLPNVTAWRTSRMHQALRESGGSAAHVMGICLAVAGLAVLLYECFMKGISRRYKELLKQRNEEFDRKYKGSVLDEEGK
ncbi:hypothetical protein [Paenibacillus glycinis]|uniref:DUF4235 domain-containing protein n=1 Tax=Paenibacillus glycinis TaxID=2697035 RepID=A0ABW9XIR0_9BACL|nr:hypothetical protein [Paenibacillus glycinis]NBD22347.1 hypothetical protein [Paenibacillus glycinis]